MSPDLMNSDVLVLALIAGVAWIVYGFVTLRKGPNR